MTFRLGLALLAAGLAALPVFARQAAAEPQSRISGPVVHENVAVYFVHGSSASGPVPLTLQEALAKGTVELMETGNVRELQIRNTGAEPVFIQFGDIVKGGQQDRVLTVSMLLEPKSGLVPIGAFCVEQGRWAARGKEDVKRFALSEALMPSREAKLAMVKPTPPAPAPQAAPATAGRPELPTAAAPAPGEANVTAQRRTRNPDDPQSQQRIVSLPSGRGDAQSEVWRNVSVMQRLLSSSVGESVASEKSRSSLQLSLEHEKLKAAQSAYIGVLEPAGQKDDDIVGVVIAVNGRLSSADVYPSNGLFRKMWPKLARAAATEALTGKTTEAVASPAAPPASAPPAIDHVRSFLTDTEAGKPSERSIEGFARYETREADKAIRLEAKSAAGALVHRNYLAK